MKAGKHLRCRPAFLTVGCLALTITITGVALAQVEVILTPVNPPIQIPATGGSFNFNIAIENNDTTSSQTFAVWCMVTLPNGSPYGPVLGPVNLTLDPGMSVNRDRSQNVPAGAPWGNYQYIAYSGIYPSVIWSSDSFPFEKLEAPTAFWTRTYGGSGCEVGESVQQTAEGGYIIAGTTSSYGAGDNDLWLIKTNALGDCTWSRTFGGSGTDVGRCAKQTQDGGYILVGCANSFSTGGNDYDLYLIKTDSAGNELWSHTFGDSGGEYGESVQQTRDGGYIATGQTYAYGTGGWDVYLLKTDGSGNELWSQTFNESYADCGEGVQQTLEGGYIVAGWASSSSGASEVLLIKTDGGGHEAWRQTLGVSGNGLGQSVQQTQDGGYVIAGWTYSYITSSNDVCLIKTDTSGNALWSQSFGGNRVDLGFSGQQTLDGGYIITGYTNSFGAGGDDLYLIKTDESGAEQWTHTFGGISSDYGYSVQQTRDGGYIMVGYTYSFGAGGSDIWLIKIASETIADTALEGMKSSNTDFMREEERMTIPGNYALLQNHPNPFNATTVVRYKMQDARFVSLRVYDTAGRLVATLVEGWREAGEHRVTFDGSGLAAGVYLYRLTAGGQTESGKMVLLK